MSADKLYTTAVLTLAVSLSEYPWRADPPLYGTARSATCGSSLEIGIWPDRAGAIGRIGLKVQACAIGQAATAIFARAAVGASRDELAAAEAAIVRWLSNGGALPDWPGLEVIAAARDYPMRHGAILLPWRAALAALPSAIQTS